METSFGDTAPEEGYAFDMRISDQLIPNKPALEIHAEVLLQRPNLAMGIALAIAGWANIEARLEALFLFCTRDETDLLAFRDCRGWDARTKLFYRSVLNRQGQEAATEVRAILRTVEAPAKKRHEIAHGIWAICRELPNDLILLDGSYFLETARQAVSAEAADLEEMRFDSAQMQESSRVVSISHLEALHKEMNQAVTIINAFMIEKMPPVVHVAGRDQVLPARTHPSVAARISASKTSKSGGSPAVDSTAAGLDNT